MMAKSKRKAPKVRSLETLAAIVHCKGSAMRDRRERRAKDHKRSWIREEH